MYNIAQHGASNNNVNWNTDIYQVSRICSADAVGRQQSDLVCDPLLYGQPVKTGECHEGSE